MRVVACTTLLLASQMMAGCWTAELPQYAGDGMAGERVVRLHPVQVADGAVPEDERARLRLFVAALPPRYASQFTVNAGGATAEADAQAVVIALDQVQVPVASVHYRPSPGPVLVTAETIELLPQRCFGTDEGTPRLEVPLGCATQYNLTRMIEQPGDLLIGRTPGPAFSAPIARAAGSYLGLTDDGADRAPGAAPGVRTSGAPPEEPSPPQGASPEDTTPGAPPPAASGAGSLIAPSGQGGLPR